jgi:hypothetical protein
MYVSPVRYELGSYIPEMEFFIVTALITADLSLSLIIDMRAVCIYIENMQANNKGRNRHRILNNKQLGKSILSQLSTIQYG